MVAGQFYPSGEADIRKQIRGFLSKKTPAIEAIACIVPHAGYIFSGKVAARTFSRVNIKKKIILIGPNHTGSGAKFSIMTEGEWATPLRKTRIDSSLSKSILARSKYLEDDSLAHMREHSLEVELPLIQYLKEDFEIVPIVVFPEESRILKEIGKAIADSVMDAGLKDSCLIVASSDMTHYEPFSQAKKKDSAAIEAINQLDEDKLARRVLGLDISMCGYAPVAIMLSAAKELGATQAELVDYQTSGEVSGDFDNVVGYAGMIIY